MKNKPMKNHTLAVLLIFALLGGAACSSDETGQVSNNSDSNNSVNNVQDNNGSDANSSADVEEETDTSSSGGEDTDLPGDTGGSDAGPKADVEEETDTDPGEPDVEEYPDVEPVDCAFPSDDENCPAGDFGAGTFLNEFTIVGDRSCCYDFDGNGSLDNFLGSLIGTVSNLPGFGDVNANINAAIQVGELVYLFEYSELEHPKFDSDLTLTVYEGRDSDEDFGPNLVGAGDFEVLPHSYEMPGVPKWQFEQARVLNGELLATGGRLRISFPGMLDEIDLILEKVRIRAKIVDETGKEADLKAGGRVWLTQGELAGALDRDTLFESLNEAGKGCECIQDAEAIFAYNSTHDSYTCALSSADKTRCRTASVECQNLAADATCMFLGLQSNKVDVDTDGDDKPDAFSFGARFSGVGASIQGIAGE